MPLQWINSTEAHGNQCPTGQPAVGLERLYRVMDRVRIRGNAGAYFAGDDHIPKAAIERINGGIPQPRISPAHLSMPFAWRRWQCQPSGPADADRPARD